MAAKDTVSASRDSDAGSETDSKSTTAPSLTAFILDDLNGSTPEKPVTASARLSMICREADDAVSDDNLGRATRAK